MIPGWRLALVAGAGLASAAAVAGGAEVVPDPTAAAAATGAETRAPCSARVELRPARAVAGQQVAYVVRIVRRDDVRAIEWARPLRFPGLRAEWLPGGAENATRRAGGHGFRVREEARALFAARPGRFEIPPAALRCRLERPEADGEPFHTAEVPAAVLDVEPVPAAGRPPDFGGIVGRVRIQTVAHPTRVALGRSLRVSVSLRGPANLWVAAAPFAGGDGANGSAAFGRAEVFAARPETETEAGPELFVRRRFVYDVVPNEVGRLVVPPVRVPYYDPEARAYAVATSEPIEVWVEPAAGPEPGRSPAAGPRNAEGRSPTGSPAATATRPGAAGGDRSLPLPPGALALVAAVFALAAGVLGREAWARHRRPWRAVDEALRDADAAARDGSPADEATALARALRRALAASLAEPGWADLDTPELARRMRGRPDERAAAARRAALEELEQLDRVRFSPDPALPQRDAVDRAIRSLRGIRSLRAIRSLRGTRRLG